MPGQQIRLDVGRSQLAVGGGDRNDLRSAKSLQRAAFVGLKVRGRRSEHGLPRAQQRGESGNVRTGSVEREIYVGLGAEKVLEARDRARGPRIVAVTNRISVVGRNDGLQYLRCNRRIVIAAEAAAKRSLHGWRCCVKPRAGTYLEDSPCASFK